MVLADDVSNARGSSSDSAANTRVNTAAHHKLMGFNTSLSVNVANYLSLTHSGSDALLKVDVDGQSNFFNAELSINLTGVWPSLSLDTPLDLLTDRVILA